jgi:Domain of unknown function (DUF4965)/Domain of unknown function (DUF1793)/Domain of unknown function (DUF5127)/Domain of unknown function (DUF4964)
MGRRGAIPCHIEVSGVPTIRSSFFIASLLFSAASMQTVSAQQPRPPAVPLIAHNPYFSIWSMNDHLTDGPTRHWTGAEQPLTGLIRIDGKNYRYMGEWPREAPAMQQDSLDVRALNTVYAFSAAGIKLQLDFFTPAFPQDLDLLSRPVTYLTWNVSSSDSQPHKVELLLDVDGRIAVDTDNEAVTWGRTQTSGLNILNIGSQSQQVLNRSGDDLRIDWGYFHLGVPSSEKAALAASSDAVHDFLESGTISQADDMSMPRTPRDGGAHLAVAFPLDLAPGQTASRHVLVSYTEEYAIEYLNRKERPYWQRNNEPVQQMLAEAEQQYPSLVSRGDKYDSDLARDLDAAGGPAYRQIALLAYRQTLAAHGLVADLDGKPMLFAKENFSNGDIATVDVLYPSSPFFLFFNPALLEAQLRPVLQYAALPRWKFPFAPHDLGRYPLADGQEYGGGERTEDDQMPVEESGNLLILGAALGQTQGNWHLAKEFWPQFTKWAQYLREKGLDPENQLSTDDFAGHLAHNANLSIKAIDALEAYAQMARGLGETSTANEYSALAKQMAAKWEPMARDGDHYKLAFDRPGTWSQKYNLVWDQLLDLNIFPAEVREREIASYLKRINTYGLPLDNRADYTKLDWEIWTATLAAKQSDFNTLVDPILKWTNEAPSRVPLNDWYDTKTGKKIGFQARSVVGGVYIKALADKQLAAKWRGKVETRP